MLPRTSLLARANLRGESEPVVANITQLVVVVAPLPQPDFFIVDRYLCAATAAGIQGAVAVNKSDLEANKIAREEIEALAAAGYRHVTCSATDGSRPRRVARPARRRESACSSASRASASLRWSNALLPKEQIETGGLMREEEGRHTTTASRSYPLDSGGTLIDSPGVRDFAPAIEQLDAEDARISGDRPRARATANSRTADTCRNRPARSSPPWKPASFSRADTKVIAACADATTTSSKRAARRNAAVKTSVSHEQSSRSDQNSLHSPLPPEALRNGTAAAFGWASRGAFGLATARGVPSRRCVSLAAGVPPATLN